MEKYLYLVSWQHVGDKSLICQCTYFTSHKLAKERFEEFKNNDNFKHVAILKIKADYESK